MRLFSGLLISTLALGTIVATGCPEHRYQTNNPYYGYSGYYRGEDPYYRQWLAERRYNYIEYNRLNSERQRQYWEWRNQNNASFRDDPRFRDNRRVYRDDPRFRDKQRVNRDNQRVYRNDHDADDRSRTYARTRDGDKDRHQAERDRHQAHNRDHDKHEKDDHDRDRDRR
jgi:hypothetical protein